VSASRKPKEGPHSSAAALVKGRKEEGEREGTAHSRDPLFSPVPDERGRRVAEAHDIKRKERGRKEKCGRQNDARTAKHLSVAMEGRGREKEKHRLAGSLYHQRSALPALGSRVPCLLLRERGKGKRRKTPHSHISLLAAGPQEGSFPLLAMLSQGRRGGR